MRNPALASRSTFSPLKLNNFFLFFLPAPIENGNETVRAPIQQPVLLLKISLFSCRLLFFRETPKRLSTTQADFPFSLLFESELFRKVKKKI